LRTTIALWQHFSTLKKTRKELAKLANSQTFGEIFLAL